MPIPSAEPDPCLLDCRVPGGVAEARAALTGPCPCSIYIPVGADKQANIEINGPQLFQGLGTSAQEDLLLESLGRAVLAIGGA